MLFCFHGIQTPDQMRLISNEQVVFSTRDSTLVEYVWPSLPQTGAGCTTGHGVHFEPGLWYKLASLKLGRRRKTVKWQCFLHHNTLLHTMSSLHVWCNVIFLLQFQKRDEDLGFVCDYFLISLHFVVSKSRCSGNCVATKNGKWGQYGVTVPSSLRHPRQKNTHIRIQSPFILFGRTLCSL